MESWPGIPGSWLLMCDICGLRLEHVHVLPCTCSQRSRTRAYVVAKEDSSPWRVDVLPCRSMKRLVMLVASTDTSIAPARTTSHCPASIRIRHRTLQLRALPPTPRNRQAPPRQLLLNNLPPTHLLLLLQRRLALAVHRDIRRCGVQTLQLWCLGELFGCRFDLVGGVEVGEGAGGADDGVREADAGELVDAFEDLGGGWVSVGGKGGR